MQTDRVLIIHTGGTIGMLPTEQGLAPAAGFEQLLRQRLAERLDTLPAFDLLELDPLIDSAELSPRQWNSIAAPVIERYGDYAGFIVLHGTDTLAYTASALSFMLQGLAKPVILTGSQIPLAERRSDADSNLLGALELAVRPEINEVCIYFNGRLLRGNRSVKMDASALSAFESPNLAPLGEVGIAISLRTDLMLAPGKPSFSSPEFDPAAVAVIRLFPGISATLIQAVLSQPGLGGVILQSYGVGNAPTSDAALMETLESAIAQGTTVVNLTQCSRGAVAGDTYATGAALSRIGVISGADLTLEAAFAKLHWLLAKKLSAAEVAMQMRQPLCGEKQAS
ncbi:type I asparaginase [Marinobacterium sp. YM272]|uniref:type I asparaginase n=1 Tax=Marinobacterium sp. YM272 TaxID=3421654 RepID=UPI003D7F59A1